MTPAAADTTPTVPSAAPSAAPAWLADDVRRLLTATPRQLPAHALYDDLGSALFDAICHLPWYPIPRAERRLLDRHGADILAAAGRPGRMVELGPGNGDKLRRLLTAAGATSGWSAGKVDRVDLVDVSPAALDQARATLTAIPGLSVATHRLPYEAGLRAVAGTRSGTDQLCVAFLGSSLGNFDPDGVGDLLATVRASVRGGDGLLLGVDLVKPVERLLLAYDDPLGLTAAFNKNLLVRLNREMHATFDVGAFDHRALWDPVASRVEMHLVSRHPQHVAVPALGLEFALAAGETIWTESSYKFRPQEIADHLRRAGFTPATRWVDEEGQFLLALGVAS